MSRSLVVERVRRRLADGGLVPATALPPAVEGRPDDFRLVDSRVVEGDALAVRPVGPAEACPEPLAFLDGIQRHEVVAFSGVHPVAVAEISAAVRLRQGRDVRTVHRAERRLVLAAPAVLGALGELASECEHCPVDWDGEGPAHPLKALELIRQAIDRERGRLERQVAERFRRDSAAWVVVDGGLSDNPGWAGDPRAIGVSKSHATLPFSGDALVTYLQLPAGYRTSLFEPAMSRVVPVLSWGLRLWPWEGQDLLHGLVRVEVPDHPGAVASADRISRWLLAERVPLSRPDQRWDRLLYGVAGVERHLRGR